MNGSTKDLTSRARFELVLPSRAEPSRAEPSRAEPSRAEAIGACDRGGARRRVNRPTWGGRLLATRGLAAVHLVVFAALFVLPHQVRAQADGICGRTATVRTAILAKIDGINDCGLVTSNHLAAITGVLSLNDQSITALAAGDFDGLTSLVTLFLYNNELTALPDDVFDGLTALTRLDLDNNDLDTLPDDVFGGVTSLFGLHLNDNELTTLPDDVFEPLTSLTDRLYLEGNPGAPFAPSAVALPDDGTVPSGARSCLTAATAAGRGARM